MASSIKSKGDQRPVIVKATIVQVNLLFGRFEHAKQLLLMDRVFLTEELEQLLLCRNKADFFQRDREVTSLNKVISVHQCL